VTDVLVYPLGLAMVIVILSPFPVCILKGRGWNCLWWFLPMIGYWIVVGSAIRLARPDSWWYRRRYDEAKRARSELRFT
jgi:purine-cytosine permease-like protein